MSLKKLPLGIMLLSGAALAASLQPAAPMARPDAPDVPDHHGHTTPPQAAMESDSLARQVHPSLLEALADSIAKPRKDSLDIGAIPTIDLDEFVITSVATPIVAKQDTLEFNAGSFKTVTNATVEDLLKKLPGVEVGSDGSITSGGKTIKKILVDGKEFFADDPQLATKNLPSNMVDKVQVIDRKSDLARMTGIDDGDDETVINLKVKKEMRNGLFGNVTAGYSPMGDRYSAQGMLNWFFNGNQITLIAGGNNVNELGFGDGRRGNFSMSGGNGGELASQRIGINFNVGKEEKFRVGGNVFYSHSVRDVQSRSETQYLFPDSVSYSSAGSKTRDAGHSLRGDLRLQWNINDNNSLEFRPRFQLDFRDTQLNDSSKLRAGDAKKTLVNDNRNARTNSGTSWDLSGQLVFNHKSSIRPGRSMSAMVNYSFSETRQHGTTWSDIEYYLRKDDSEELLRYLDSRQWSNSIEGRLSWTEPLGDVKRGNFLDVSYKLSYKFNNADKLTYGLDPDAWLPADRSGIFDLPEFSGAPAGIDFDPTLSNRFRNNYLSQELQVGYKKVSKKLNLNAGLLFAPASSSSIDLIDSKRNIPTRYVWNVGPFLRMRLRFNGASSLNIRYRSRTSQPSLTALQPVEDVSNPLNIIVGNPNLKPTFTQTVNAMFNTYSAEHQQSVAAMVSASYALNSVVQRTVANPLTGGRTTTYANANGDLSIFGMGMFSRVLPNKRFSFNARLGARFSSAPGYIDGDFNRTGNLNLSPSAGLRFSNDLLQIGFNPTYSFGLVTNSLPKQPSRATHSYGFDADVIATLPFGLQISSDLSFSNTAGYAQGYNSASWLWNAQLSYSFLKDRQLGVFVKAYDILGLNKNISRTTSASMIVDREMNNISRYVMVGLTWNFTTLKKGDSLPAEHFGPGEGPDGPPGRKRGERQQGGNRVRSVGSFPMGGPPPGRM